MTFCLPTQTIFAEDRAIAPSMKQKFTNFLLSITLQNQRQYSNFKDMKFTIKLAAFFNLWVGVYSV